jgi:hypothetical protein
MLIFFLLLNIISGMIMPQTGSIYRKVLSIPLIGEQNIETEFSNNNLIFIRLSGIVVENGTAEYNIIDDKVNIILSNNLDKIIEKRRSEFKIIGYDEYNDILKMFLYVRPIFLKKNIELERIND